MSTILFFLVLSMVHSKGIQKVNHVCDWSQKGIVLCASNPMIPYIHRMVYQVQHTWNSSLPFLVAHCSEISLKNQLKISSFGTCVRTLDICISSNDSLIFGMNQRDGVKKLRGFFCKIAGLLSSTFEETMLIDLDVVWFKQPDTVFNYKGYKSSGALFFRDRIYVNKTVPKKRAHPGDVMSYLKLNNITIDKKNAAFIMNNQVHTYPLYWRYILGNGPFATEGYQDSSLLIVNKRKHPKLLIALREIICETRLGYGDKELFWLAATASKENFVFEPFLAGQYGDCYGLILHFDPNDELLGSSARPLYINAEYMVELRHLKAIGTLLRSEMTVPLLVNGSTRILDMGTYSQPKNFHIGLTDSSPNSFRGCTCPKVGCQNITYDIDYHLIHTQWLTWSFRQNCKRECVPIRAAASMILADVMKDFHIRNHCYFTGCTSMATLNQSLPWKFNDQYCDHVDFYTKDEPLMMENLAREARTPFNTLNFPLLEDDQLVMCGSHKAVYLFKNGSLHTFPNMTLFENMGKKIGNIKLIKERSCLILLMGKPVE